MKGLNVRKAKILRKVGESGNILVTHAVGSKYFDTWSKVAKSSWLYYCDKHDLGLYVFTEVIEDDGKTFYWQKMLIASELRNIDVKIKSACYLDTDIIINPGAPNIFASYDPDRIAFVSQYKNLPYNRLSVLRRVAFFRHNFYSKKYPLDSSLFYSAKETYKFHNLRAFDDYACMGLFIFNIDNHADFLKGIFHRYQKDHLSLDGGGEEVYLNYEVLNADLVQWIPYKWQSLWIFEMPWCHSHLYFNYSRESLINSVKTSLYNCNFLHFAGSWEGIHFEECEGLFEDLDKNGYLLFEKYLEQKLTRKPQGRITRK
jgi:hypothetical protein